MVQNLDISIGVCQ